MRLDNRPRRFQRRESNAGKNLTDELFTGGGQYDVEGAAVVRIVESLKEAAGFEAVDEAGDVWSWMHDELTTKFDLECSLRTARRGD